LHVAHLNHNFRGQEAEDDAVFVAEVAKEQGLPVTVVKEDPHEYQRVRGISSFEQGAREMRYAFLARVAMEAGARAVTVGHTSDDLAETVMLHVLRGSGLYGLRGMREVSDWPWPAEAAELKLFRPLLDVTKAQTIEYCHEIGCAYRKDSGNYMWRFTRNRVRQDLMPKLAEDYNPQVRNALVRLARTAAEELDFVEQQLDKVWHGMASESDGEVRVSRSGLSGLHPLLQRLALRRGYILVAGNPTRLRESHMVAMEEMAAGERGGRSLNLPAGVVLRQEYEQLVVTRSLKADCPYPNLGGAYNIVLPGETGVDTASWVGPWLVAMHTGNADQPPDWARIGDEWTARLDLSAIGNDATVRTWRPGDRIQPLGMEGQKKLQDLFTDSQVPRYWREHVPLLDCKRGIAWVVGHRIADWAKVNTRPSGLVLWLRFSQSEA
jgi:tRNA(Ile)-lysidine synthase